MSDAPTFEQVLEATAYKGIPHNDARIRCARAIYDHMTEARRTVSGQEAVGIVSKGLPHLPHWHFEPYVNWESIGHGTKLYAAPIPATELKDAE